MALDSWTLGSLLQQMRAEFGLRDQADHNEFLTDKINQAIKWICRLRDNFWFLRKELIIEIPDQYTITYNATRGGRTITLDSAPSTPVALRDIFVPSATTGDSVSGYLVAEIVSSVEFVIETNYRGADVTSGSGSIQKGLFELPVDAVRLESLSRSSDLVGDGEMQYRDPITFEKIKRNQLSISLYETLYTTRPDPLGLNSRVYLSVYPYISTLDTLQGQYTISPPKLVNNSDVPVIPVNDQDTVFYYACWFFAQARGHESTPLYQAQALQAAQVMLGKPEFVDPDRMESTSDRKVGDFLLGPSSYPEFE